MESFAIVIGLLLCALPTAWGRPNVIIMQPDDIEFMASWTPPAHFPARSSFDLDLPNIERLRNDGLEMKRAYAASPMCGTSRYSTMTGRYPSRSSISRRRNSGSPISSVTIPSTKLQDNDRVVDGNDCTQNNLAALFQNNGYSTGVFGKWHLHAVDSATYDYDVVRGDIQACGFDTAEGIYYENLNDDWTNNGAITHNMEHLTEEAIKFIDKAVEEEEEFFLYFNPTAPHASGSVVDALTSGSCLDAPQGMLPNEPVVRGMTVTESGESIGCEAYRQSIVDRGQGDTSNAVLGAIWVDDAVGALLLHLEEIGQLDSTIFLFQMDHGQEGKGSLYEPGTRIAQFIHYPDEIASGSTYAGLVSTIDIGPTMAAYAGFNEFTTGWYPMDGLSWRGLEEETESRCLVLELDYDRAVVCECDKYLSIGDATESNTFTLGDRNGLVTTTGGFNLCDNGRDYTTSPRFNTESEVMSDGVTAGISNILNCHLSMTEASLTEAPEYGICDHLQSQTPSPTSATLSPTVFQTPAPTDAPRCTCTSDASIDEAFYEESTDNTRRTIRTNGIPNHVFHTDRDRANPNPVCIHPSELSVPLNPELNPNGFTETALGVIGVLKTGAFLYNHKSNNLGIDDVANHPDNEQPGLDLCHGHAGGTCLYHYHEVSRLSECTHDDDWNECELIGYLRDGFPIYSHCRHPTEDRYLTSCFHLRNDADNGGGDDTSDYEFDETDQCDLDFANGYDFTGAGITDAEGNEIRGYAYIVSSTYPYVMAAYRGVRFWPVRDVDEPWVSPTPPPEPTPTPMSSPTQAPPEPTSPPLQEEPNSSTPAPSESCFSERNQVVVKNKGQTPIKDVSVGDMVLVAGGKYEPVYSFCKRSTESMGEYIQVFSSELKEPLELTGNHLVFIVQEDGEHTAIRASRLETGDILFHHPARRIAISQLKTIQRNGAYAPYTASGTIVVNGVLASTYATLSDGILSNDSQELLHFSQTHHRVLCHWFPEMCRRESYSSDDGLSFISKVSQDIYNLVKDQDYKFITWYCSLMIVIGLVVLRAVELSSSWGMLSLMIAIVWRYHRRKTKQKSFR